MRQGDILILPLAQPPANLGSAMTPGPRSVDSPYVREDGRVVLAEGEATGHHHSIAGSDGVRLFRPDHVPAGGAVLVVEGAEARLEHQEHTAIVLPPGAYEVRRQRQWDAGRASPVQD